LDGQWSEYLANQASYQLYIITIDFLDPQNVEIETKLVLVG